MILFKSSQQPFDVGDIMKEETKTQRNIEYWPRITSPKLVKAESWIPTRFVNPKSPFFYYATVENEDATSPSYTYQKLMMIIGQFTPYFALIHDLNYLQESNYIQQTQDAFFF